MGKRIQKIDDVVYIIYILCTLLTMYSGVIFQKNCFVWSNNITTKLLQLSTFLKIISNFSWNKLYFIGCMQASCRNTLIILYSSASYFNFKFYQNIKCNWNYMTFLDCKSSTKFQISEIEYSFNSYQFNGTCEWLVYLLINRFLQSFATQGNL